MATATKTVKIQNRLGMHARPAMLFAEIAGKFSASITVGHKDSDQVDAKSIMQLMMLAATEGTALIINADGDDANDAISELVELVTSGFNE
ncbi:MAG TPA: HPr family phosphocarrier protein [Phycisphaerales bacterium]|jgi:phosphocarrier protein|nr:HPr family phosphocarrier protein [Phycisphaerales bacterium]HIB00571.1 HPr family phosphocarrier protein [Phycisphaerales bacterium]HIB51114.1 HPr family phosphocarrier protein [Phycisphaerales bacterium]HIN83564.1 HPr family phosphocarrier protein [Phycisphaerales bacterium]HIO20619.1 HPr family phosphocarrier protein [Phycisphaerales bacterium]